MPNRKRVIVEYRHYHLPSDFPVLLLSGERWRISDIPSGRLHFHNCLEIGICRSDSGIMEFEGNQIPFHTGDVTCVPRHLPHTTYSSPGTESLWSYVFVDIEEMFRGFFRTSPESQELFLEAIKDFRHIMSRDEYPHVYFLADAIIRELEQKKQNYKLSVQGLFLSLYVELIRIQNNTRSKGALDLSSHNALVISPALEYIDLNYTQQITIGELADLCFISETQFRRLFNSIMGTPPLDYINTTRIYKACALMRSTDASILSISEQVGFHSISSFNRCFSKVMNTAPRKWRGQMQKATSATEKQSIQEFSGWIR